MKPDNIAAAEHVDTSAYTEHPRMSSIEKIKAKIIDRNSLSHILEKKKNQGKKVVFTNGCFDILHRGHIEYLSGASDLGDVFVIGLNSDKSVRKLKGKTRPAIDEESRSLTLASFEFVDYLILFSEDTPSELMRALKPDVWVKGGDYTNIEDLPEHSVMMGIEGEVVILPFVEGFSTSDIYNKILGAAKS